MTTSTINPNIPVNGSDVDAPPIQGNFAAAYNDINYIYSLIASAVGTVTNVSVVTANGITGTVANPTTIPSITLGTTITGLLKGNGTSISAATAGTDYLTPTGNGSGLTAITAANISPGTAALNVTGNAATVTTISGLISQGANVTITGSGTQASPYVIASTGGGGGGGGFDSITSGTNTSAAMVVGSGATFAASGSGTITATAVPASGITGTTLASGVVTSSLTTVGTLSSLTVTGNITNSALTASYAVVTDASKNLASLAYGSVNTGSTIMSRDLNGNTAVNNIIITSTATAATGQIVNMTYGSAGIQQSTGTGNITYVLPDATTLFADETFEFNADTTGSTTIYKHDGSTLVTSFLSGAYAILVCTNNGTTNGAWDVHFASPSNSVWTTAGMTVTGTLTATGHVTFESVTSTGATGTGNLVFSTNPTFDSGITVGTVSANTGTIKLKGTTSGTVTLSTADAAGTWTMKLPTTAGTNLYFLQTDGSGNTTWAAPATSGTVTSIVAGTGLTGGTITSTGTIALDLTQGNAWTGATAFNPARTIASGANAVLDDVSLAAETTTVTGTTGITTSKGFNKVSIYKPTITDSSSVTITTAASLYVEAAPLAAGSVTITNPWAINVGSGNVQFPGTGNVVGTITSGIWNGTSIAVANGGTGASSASITAFNNITGYTASGATGTTSTNLVFSGSPTITTPVLTGLPTGTGVASAATASTLASRDANANTTVNNLIENYATTSTAASTTTLTVASAYQQFFTGTTTQTVLLPVTSTLVLGQSFEIVNNSTGVVTVQSSGANTIQAMAAGTTAYYTCVLLTGTTATSWSVTYIAAAGGSGTVTSVTFTGDGTILSSTPSSAVTTSGTVTGTLANAAAGTVLGNATTSSAAPTYTSAPVLGKSGTAGSIGFGNATSGIITLQPVTGALGTVTVSIPAATDTLVNLGSTQTLTNKTLTSPVLTTPALGTPASGVATNLTGVASGLIAGQVANANLLAQTAAVTNIINYTTANDSTVHTYILYAYFNVTASVTDTLGFSITFKDENNNTQTVATTALFAAGVTAYRNFQLNQGTGALTIRAYPNTAITFSTTQTVSSGSISYDVGGTLMQIA